MRKLKALLDEQYSLKNTIDELQATKPDPLYVARFYTHSSYFAEIALLCALLSYGNAKAIVHLLQGFDFSLLQSIDTLLKRDVQDFSYYRFQTRADIKALFEIIAAMLENGGLERLFLYHYKHPPKSLTLWNRSGNKSHARLIYGIYACIESMLTIAQKRGIVLTQGLSFALGTSHYEMLRACGNPPRNASALKRWAMLLRWLVRKDELDVGCWQEHISPADLILPLDTHTFALCSKLKILARKSYDLQSALQATDTLAFLRPHDPVAYDFALYRIGQGKVDITSFI